jgi:flagellar basal-body rod protein FlgB
METIPITVRGTAAARQATTARSPAGPLALAERRLNWLDRRQTVLAQNVANADTPGFRPMDITPFARALSARTPQGMARTTPGHLAGAPRHAAGATQDRLVAEATPDGNAVSLDREALRIAETDSAHALAMAVHRSFMGMFRLALGRQG